MPEAVINCEQKDHGSPHNRHLTLWGRPERDDEDRRVARVGEHHRGKIALDIVDLLSADTPFYRIIRGQFCRMMQDAGNKLPSRHRQPTRHRTSPTTRNSDDWRVPECNLSSLTNCESAKLKAEFPYALICNLRQFWKI